MHLKIFLGELQSKLLKNDNQDDGSKADDEGSFGKVKTLSENLNDLETAKKNIINSLQECVKVLAQTVKETERKIQ